MATEHPHRHESIRIAEEPARSGDPPASKRRRPAPGRLRLTGRRPLRAGVLGAFSRILGAARRLARTAEHDPVAAVHEYRKSLRRARALVALLAPCLGKPAALGLRRRLQAAFRATNALRDADVLLETLRAVPPDAEDDLARHAIEVALELEQGRTRKETSETLEGALQFLGGLPAALEVLLKPQFSTRDLERGLTRSRQRERRALEQAMKTRSDEDLHEWRKRVKELRYQVELLASKGGGEIKRREKSLGRLAQDLGAVTDLIVLAREIGEREREGTVPASPALKERIRELAAKRSGPLLELGAKLFEGDAKLFARQVLGERG